MAKFFLLSFLFFTIQIPIATLFASNISGNLENRNLSTDLCDTPAPDSFWVTGREINSIAVAWNPVWSEASYTLSVLTRTNLNNTWIILATFSNVTGSTLNINGVTSTDECKMVIATNCSDGSPGIQKKELLDKIIIELATGGRNPLYPVPTSCTNMSKPGFPYNWVGFRVIQNSEFTPQNIFEVVTTYSPPITKISINRVSNNNIIFASNNDNVVPPPTLKTGFSFKVIKRVPNIPDYTIGKLLVTINGLSIEICQDPSFSWDNSYSFIPLTSQMPSGYDVPPVTGAMDIFRNESNSNAYSRIRVQSPFNENLHIFLESQNKIPVNTKIRLLAMSGQTVFEQQIQTQLEEISIPVGEISSGVYILRIETENETKTTKVVKND